MVRTDKRAACQSAGSFDDLIHRNRIAARAEVLLTLVNLPNNMLEDVKEDLLEIYEEEGTGNE